MSSAPSNETAQDAEAERQLDLIRRMQDEVFGGAAATPDSSKVGSFVDSVFAAVADPEAEEPDWDGALCEDPESHDAAEPPVASVPSVPSADDLRQRPDADAFEDEVDTAVPVVGARPAEDGFGSVFGSLPDAPPLLDDDLDEAMADPTAWRTPVDPYAAYEDVGADANPTHATASDSATSVPVDAAPAVAPTGIAAAPVEDGSTPSSATATPLPPLESRDERGASAQEPPLREEDEKETAGEKAGAFIAFAAEKFRTLPKAARIALPALAVLLVLAGVLSMCTGGGAKKGTAAPAPVTVVETPTVSDSAVADAPLTLSKDILKVEAKPGSCAAGSTSPQAAFESDASRAWVCNRGGFPDGGWVDITFRYPVVITEIRVIPGFNYKEPNGEDKWLQYRLMNLAVWRIQNEPFAQKMSPTRTGATIKLTNPIAAQTMSMQILQSELPPKPTSGPGSNPGKRAAVNDAVAISKIEIIGRPAAGK